MSGTEGGVLGTIDVINAPTIDKTELGKTREKLVIPPFAKPEQAVVNKRAVNYGDVDEEPKNQPVIHHKATGKSNALTNVVGHTSMNYVLCAMANSPYVDYTILSCR